ncbi:transcriptional regulator, XRE family [Desulfofarcimen acetoxidans DSM 771]|uniref:Transcriptional regulator, XRE family n=1 Tax=Desulfofarcimen acetoxidans (strain ATCC 49208 / DSM 771 / KCTC 5769 / VKM B-1644 / 5575) TaxID=485916 RepID=C8W122_DESAS|nr:helix-turn-helix transcriptional regulator [Desulfofarcimen acetoxidans]ACV63418.1 transcriptional regulator, XRE family [Desulfofarcimen acetoxidans DSM 771]
MVLNIGEVITAKRKEKLWTQEQLANAVGVSTPAVSKWETGTTYPDIMLLSPIARALNTTVDKLLSYQNELSDEEVDKVTKDAMHVYESEGFDAGWSFCQRVLKEYPNSIPLKFHLGNLFQSFMILKSGIDQQEMQTYYRNAVHIYEEVLSSRHPKYALHTTAILVSYYAMLSELDKAEQLIEGMPSQKLDPDSLYPSIYALRGKHGEAIKLTQENLQRYISRVSQSLGVLCSYARERDDMETAYTLAKINFEMAKLFGMKEEIAYPDMIKVLVSRGDKQTALNYLEEYAQSIAELKYDYSNNPCFNRLTKGLSDTSYIKKILAQSILTDREYAPLKDEPRHTQVFGKLQELANTQTNTFRATDV